MGKHTHQFEIVAMKLKGDRETAGVESLQLECSCGLRIAVSDPYQWYNRGWLPMKEVDFNDNGNDKPNQDPF